MDKTVILAIDRDDDFGNKAGISTPCIGLEACEKAAMALAEADPEDSDSNSLFNAIKTYKEMNPRCPEGALEIALICGASEVGFVSDQKLTEQLQTVIATVQPKQAYIVTDGAEDDAFINVIGSQIRIIGTKKTIVKQVPTFEGALAIFSRYLKEPQKRVRYIAPIGYVLIMISLVYIIANYLNYPDLHDFFVNSTTLILVGALGIIVTMYAYSFPEWVASKLKYLRNGFRDTATIGAIVFCALFFALAVIMGVYSLDSVYTYRTVQKIILFCANAIWPVLFMLMTINFAVVISGLSRGKVRYNNIVGCLYIVGIGMFATAFADYLLEYVGVISLNTNLVGLEIIGGVVFFLLGAALHNRLRKSAEPVERDPFAE